MAAIGKGIGIPIGTPLTAGYQAKVLALSPIAYWPLAESAGTTADNAQGDSGFDGTYSGCTVADTTGPDGKPAPLFDAVNDVVDIYSASLDAAFDGEEGTMHLWFKVADSGVWTDGVNRRLGLIINASSHFILLDKSTASNQLRAYWSGGNSKSVTPTYSDTVWTPFGITWSKTADEVKVYLEGSQTGSTQTGMGVWTAGALNSDRCVIGANEFASPTQEWDGWIAGVALWDSPLSDANMLALATV